MHSNEFKKCTNDMNNNPEKFFTFEKSIHRKRQAFLNINIDICDHAFFMTIIIFLR
jgi:hypothetical protein